jgi:hypothetical protein
MSSCSSYIKSIHPTVSEIGTRIDAEKRGNKKKSVFSAAILMAHRPHPNSLKVSDRKIKILINH